jgi:hypothetical protein
VCNTTPELKVAENPHPIFVHFIKAAKAYAEKRMQLKIQYCRVK